MMLDHIGWMGLNFDLIRKLGISKQSQFENPVSDCINTYQLDKCLMNGAFKNVTDVGIVKRRDESDSNLKHPEQLLQSETHTKWFKKSSVS